MTLGVLTGHAMDGGWTENYSSPRDHPLGLENLNVIPIASTFYFSSASVKGNFFFPQFILHSKGIAKIADKEPIQQLFIITEVLFVCTISS